MTLTVLLEEAIRPTTISVHPPFGENFTSSLVGGVMRAVAAWTGVEADGAASAEEDAASAGTDGAALPHETTRTSDAANFLMPRGYMRGLLRPDRKSTEQKCKTERGPKHCNGDQLKNLGPTELNVILQLCECYEEVGDESELSASEMARVIRAVECGGVATVLEDGRVAAALTGRFPVRHLVWRYVRILP
jgi:hypothetical protein